MTRKTKPKSPGEVVGRVARKRVLTAEQISFDLAYADAKSEDLQRRSDAGPVCELIGGFPFVLPYIGFEIPWFMAGAMEEARELGEKVDDMRADLAKESDRVRALYFERDPSVRRLQRILGAIERRIGVAAEQVIAATRGLDFGPSDAATRAAIRDQIRWKRRVLAFRGPSAIEAPEMTADERRSLDKIERRRLEAEAATKSASTQEDQTKAYDRAARAGEEALALTAKIRARQEAEWVGGALKEVDALSKLRGDEPSQSATGARIRMSPILRLFLAELIDEAEYEALKLYGKTYERLYGGRTGDGTGGGEMDPLESRIADLKRLDRARGYDIAVGGGRVVTNNGLGGDARLISLCDRVCGEERSLREVFGTSGAKRKRGMCWLKLSGNLLAIHYGLRKARECELRAA